MSLRIDVTHVCIYHPDVPEPIGERQGGPVLSAIRKEPVPGPRIGVTGFGLEGDLQAEFTTIRKGKPLHGGPSMAVYAYPTVHYAQTWEPSRLLLPGRRLGENLGVSVTEEDVRVGDVWRWGTAELKVETPRVPCFKLEHFHQTGVMQLMAKTGTVGWYLSVVRPGIAPVAGPILRVRSESGPTVAEAWQQRGRAGRSMFVA
jgi:MOSC domain-containing protein YiiM